MINLFVILIGEIQRGIELIRYRGDTKQANLRAPHHEHTLDKQIAATAIIHNLVVVTRNEKDFIRTGVKVLNPFK